MYAAVIRTNSKMITRAWNYYKYDFAKTKVRVILWEREWWDDCHMDSMGLYPAHALPWNRPPKPVKRK